MPSQLSCNTRSICLFKVLKNIYILYMLYNSIYSFITFIAVLSSSAYTYNYLSSYYYYYFSSRSYNSKLSDKSTELFMLLKNIYNFIFVNNSIYSALIAVLSSLYTFNYFSSVPALKLNDSSIQLFLLFKNIYISKSRSLHSLQHFILLI